MQRTAQAPAYAGGGQVPLSNFGMSGGGGGLFGGLLGGGLGGIMQGLFGDSGAPFKKAGQAYQPYFNEAKGYQNPFFNFGKGAFQDYGNWLGNMRDPSQFINKQMGNYQESPWAKYLQDQTMKAGQNAGSASGLTGSTPLLQQLQQNAGGIASGDMNQWLQNVLGINTQYGQGLFGQLGMGQHAGDILSQLAGNAGEYMGGAAYGKEAGKQKDRSSLFGGIGSLFGF